MTTSSVACVPAENNPYGLLDRLTVNWISRGVDQARGYEDQQIALIAHGGLAAEQAACDRNVTEKRNLIVEFLDVLTDQSAQHDRLTVPDHDARREITAGEQWLLDVVKGRYHVVTRGDRNRAAVVDESKEFRHLGDKLQVDGVAVRADGRCDVQQHADFARLERAGNRGRHADSAAARGTTARRDDLGRLVFRRVDEFLDAANMCLRAAAGCAFGPGKNA